MRCTSIVLLLCVANPLFAQLPKYPDLYLHHVYPAGARQGQTVEVEFAGLNGLLGATEIVVDGPPGIAVRDVKAVNAGLVRATFVVTADAPVGKRLVRVAGGRNGLTNARPFFVGRLPEVLEKESNDTPDTAQEITLPAVVNARIQAANDVDCFSFRGKAGQKIVAAVLAHGMDTLHRGGKAGGFLDTNLELLDERGRVLASAEDTIGLDPVLELALPADGKYTVRVQSVFFRGTPSAVYRLTVGDVPYPTHVFPPGGKRGEKVELTFHGFNLRSGASRQFSVPAAGLSPWLSVPFDHPLSDGRDLPFVAGDASERNETEPNDSREKAKLLTLPMTINGRFERPGDEDWFKVPLKKGEGVLLTVTAQRHLRSPVDSVLEVYNAAGVKLAENDDGALFAHPNQCAHDFSSADSWLQFTAPLDGDYFVRLIDQNGGGRADAVYRLAATPLGPDFHLSQWPDAVPVWGAGSTACFVVHMQHWGGPNSDVNLRVEGLPTGWTGSETRISPSFYSIFAAPYGAQALLTITAPKDALPGAMATFRVIGRAEQGGKVIEHTAEPLTLFGSSHTDRMHFRFSSISRAVVAAPMGCRLETPVRELTVRLGEKFEIPVRFERLAGVKGDVLIGVDGPINGGAAACGWCPPVTLKADQTETTIPVTLGGKKRPGTYGVVVSRAWAADLRAGRPGPCTQLITVHVLPAK